MIKSFVAFVLLFGFVASAQQKHVDQDLRKMLDQQTAAWNRGDLEGFMQGYWHSPDLTFYSGDTINHGWEETLRRYRRRYQSGGAQMGILTFTDEQLDMFGGDAAVVSARWHLSMPNGEKREGLTTIVCKRMKDGWKIVHDHSS
jgi:beta-aspartyl-peptidase (threonine type)